MKPRSTLFLKITIMLIGFIILALCLFALPAGISAEIKGDFDYGYIFVGLYIPAVPLFYALYQSLKMLGYIDSNDVFTPAAVNTLKAIKYCAFIINALFIAGMPYIFYVADRDDAPGVAAIGFIIIGASAVIAAAASLFQKLLQSAIDIKSENDLTV